LLQYLPKDIALLVQKIWEEFFCQNPFSAILKMTTVLEGGRGVRD